MRKIYLFHIVHLLLHSCRIIMGNQAQNNRNDNNGIEGIADKVQETAITVPGNSIKTNDDDDDISVATDMHSYVDGKVGEFNLVYLVKRFNKLCNTDSFSLVM